MAKTDMLTVTIPVDLKRLGDLLCSAMEGGIGYWSQIQDYEEPKKPQSDWVLLDGEGIVYKYIDYPINGGAVLMKVCDDDGKPQRTQRPAMCWCSARCWETSSTAEEEGRSWGPKLAPAPASLPES